MSFLWVEIYKESFLERGVWWRGEKLRKGRRLGIFIMFLLFLDVFLLGYLGKFKLFRILVIYF